MPKFFIIWSNIALNRFFCHFRYFWEEIWKRKHFGRFWSEKVKKTTKSQNHVENCTWRRQRLLMTASRLDKEVDKSNYTWRAREVFEDLYMTVSPRPSRVNCTWRPRPSLYMTTSEVDLGNTSIILAASWRRQTLLLTPSDCKIYIYFSSFHSLCATLKGENPRRILLQFWGFQTLVSSMLNWR